MKKKLIILILAWSFIYIVFFYLLPYLSNKYHGCFIYKDVYGQTIKGVLLKKFSDPRNHNEETVVYLEKNIKKSIILSPESSQIFDYVDIGDSITKKRDSVVYRVNNKLTKKDTILRFSTRCGDSSGKIVNIKH